MKTIKTPWIKITVIEINATDCPIGLEDNTGLRAIFGVEGLGWRIISQLLSKGGRPDRRFVMADTLYAGCPAYHVLKELLSADSEPVGKLFRYANRWVWKCFDEQTS